MPAKCAGRSEFTELMPNHILGNINWDEPITIVNGQRMTDEIRRDRRATGPSLDDLLISRAIEMFDFFRQMPIDERAFFNRSCHDSSLLRVAAAYNPLIALIFALARLITFRRLTPRSNRVAAS